MSADSMNRGACALATLAAVFLIPPTRSMISAQLPTFRAETEAVWVTATVVDKDGRLVTDLTKDDFEVRDNGIEHDITVFRNDPIPFAVAILFDVSGSMLSNSYTMRQGVNELVSRFQPGDRATIGAFWGITEISPRFTANPKTLLGWVNATVGGGGTPCVASVTNGLAGAPRGAGSAIWNAIECGIDAVARDAETPRRVVLVITDGVDNVSILRPEDVGRYASQFGVMVYAIGMYGETGIDDTPLRALAENTGGGYFRLHDRDNLPATFARVAEELRHQYVFGITPAGGAATTHKLDVRVRRPNAVARARRVYLESVPLVTVPTAPVIAAAEPAAADARSAPSATLLETLDRFERANPPIRPASYDSVAAFRSSFEELRRAAPAWLLREPGHGPRRRLALATYALDLINANPSVIADGPTMRVRLAELGVGEPTMSPGDNPNLQPFAISASDVIEWACEILRESPPSPAERTWHLASIAALERFRGQAALDAHIAHAEARFPKDPEWALARAVSQELRTWPEPRDHPDYKPPAGFAASAVDARYKDAAVDTSTRQEAHLRWGYFELRRGHIDSALSHFAEVGEPDDVVLRYWLHLFQGRALERSGRLAEAASAYRLACSDVPYAQSATIALAAVLVADHRTDEAAALTNLMLSVAPPLDPWNFYTFPATRTWPQLMAKLREAITP